MQTNHQQNLHSSSITNGTERATLATMTRSCSHSNILVDTIVKNVLHVRTIIVLHEMHELLLLTLQILKHSLTEKQPWLLAVQSQQHICMLYVYGMSDQNYNASTYKKQWIRTVTWMKQQQQYYYNKQFWHSTN